jgi:1-acyl-sn-glycerol-3-phosphate acyltransferase
MIPLAEPAAPARDLRPGPLADFRRRGIPGYRGRLRMAKQGLPLRADRAPRFRYPMLVFRSLLFNAVFYLNLIAQMILWAPLFFLMPRKTAWFVPKVWVRSALWLQEKLAGTRSEISGMENLPEGSFILAPKHQSFWDAIAFLPHLRDPLYILKRELTWIPFFGWYILKMRLIPVDRGSRSKALKKVVADARREMAADRQLIIYPEGTRRPPGAEPAYKWGIVELYSQLGMPVFWPRRKFRRYPGTIRARFLPPIPPGLEREEFMRRLISETEAGCDALLVEAAQTPGHPPLPPTAQERLRELGAAGLES